MNITKLRPYLIAEEIRRKNENYNAWLQGVYMCEAVSVSLANAFKKKGTKPYEYMKEPLPITEKDIQERERRKQERMKQQFADYVAGLQARKDKENGYRS